MITADSRSALHAEIAAALPGDWQAQEQSLTRADGLQLDVKRQGRRYVIKPPALYLTLNSGRHTWYGNAPQITVAADRSPESIARDIARRLLPDAEIWHAEALAWRDRTRYDDDVHWATLAAFDRVAGLWRSHGEATTFHGHHLIARVDSGASATLEFRGIHPDHALAIIAVYEEARRSRSAHRQPAV